MKIRKYDVNSVEHPHGLPWRGVQPNGFSRLVARGVLRLRIKLLLKV